MGYFEDEFDHIVETNADMAQIVIESGIISTEQLNKSVKYIEKLRLRGEQPPVLLEYLLERRFLEKKQFEALKTAYHRIIADRERSAFNIQGYSLLNKIGSGGLGVVFLAKQISMKRTVAIKILHEKWANDEEFKFRFLREARVMGRLSHQNLIQVHDVGKESNNYYFSMEYVEGPTVEDLIRQKGTLSTEEALDITIQAARAIYYISQYDIVHRDIKPANLMINNNGVVKLGDFGFLFMRNRKEMGKDGYVIGTPDYISPEQASGSEIDFRSDLYSLGVCLYQMMSGLLPYSGTVSTVMQQHVTANLPERTARNSVTIPIDVYNIICKMMAKKPDDRYDDVFQLLDDLQYYKAAEIMKKRNKNDQFEHENDLENSNEINQISPLPIDNMAQDEFLVKQNRNMFIALIISLIIITFETIYFLLIR